MTSVARSGADVQRFAPPLPREGGAAIVREARSSRDVRLAGRVFGR
jgi:hypothetical protein